MYIYVCVGYFLLTGRGSYVVNKTRYAPVPWGKQNTGEIPRELRGWHVRKKCNHVDCVGVLKIIKQQKIFDRWRWKELAGKSLDVSPPRALALCQTVLGWEVLFVWDLVNEEAKMFKCLEMIIEMCVEPGSWK